MKPTVLDVLFEDNHLLVINKAAGVATMGVEAGGTSLWELAREYLRVKYHKPGNVFLGVVSRLDAAVSGVIVFARTSKAAARLSEQFRAGTPEKIYLGIVTGREAPPLSGQLVHWMGKNEAARRMDLSLAPQAGWQRAELEFQRIRPLSPREWLLKIRLLTGRKHQIRAQLAAAGWPIRGDSKYGSRAAHRLGIALHSYSLSLVHPTRKEVLCWRVPPPKTWNLDRNGLD